MQSEANSAQLRSAPNVAAQSTSNAHALSCMSCVPLPDCRAQPKLTGPQP